MELDVFRVLDWVIFSFGNVEVIYIVQFIMSNEDWVSLLIINVCIMFLLIGEGGEVFMQRIFLVQDSVVNFVLLWFQRGLVDEVNFCGFNFG